jgi:hypothetical protein
MIPKSIWSNESWLSIVDMVCVPQAQMINCAAGERKDAIFRCYSKGAQDKLLLWAGAVRRRAHVKCGVRRIRHFP